MTAARAAIRAGQYTSHTSGIARDHVQGNVVILPQPLAADFLRYCQRNPKPCPLLAVSEPGDPMLPRLGAGIDIRTDVDQVVAAVAEDAGNDRPLMLVRGRFDTARIESMLRENFTAEERADMVVDGEIEVVCEFCSAYYHFRPHDFEETKH